MIKTIYTRAVSVLLKKPLTLWGISLLQSLLAVVFNTLFGVIPGLAVAISMLLSTSMTMIFLHGYRGDQVKCVQLFDCFKDWATIKRVLCGMGWMALWIFLWALIPFVGIIFAVIRTYEYRLTPYILVTEPDVSPTEAIKISSQRTKGYKGTMFGADILVGVAFTVVCWLLGLLSRIPFIGVLFGLANLIFIVCFSVLRPLFLGLVKAAFYEEITNPTIPLTPTAPAAPAAGTHFCPNCGASVAEGAAFCPNCGSKQE